MSDIKKIAIVTPEFYGDTMVGSLAVSVHGLVHALTKKGIEVHVVMPAYVKTYYSEKFTREPFIDQKSDHKIVIDSYSRDGIVIHKITGFRLQELAGIYSSSALSNLNIEDAAYKKMMKKTFESYFLLSAAVPNVLNEAGLKDVDVIHLMEWTMASASYSC